MCLTFVLALSGGIGLCDPPRAMVLPRDPQCGLLNRGPPCVAGLITIGRPFHLRNEPRSPEIAHCFVLMKGHYDPLRAVMTFDQMCMRHLDPEHWRAFRFSYLTIF